jgi:catechol 2,3-dioxygenase-like lactoylglutathione lyase family enzyme
MLVSDTKQERRMAKITGVGGIFFRSKDPKALAAWYRDVLGFEIESYGAALLRYDAPGHPEFVVWTPVSPGSDQFAPSTREFMINLGVDDLDGVVAALEAKGVSILGRQDEDYGRFAWILDPDGTKIELWQPAPE